MLAQGFITTEQALNANTLPLEIRPLAPFPPNPYEPFTNLVIAQLSARFGLSRIQRGGLQIITTLDLDLQTQAACVASVQVSRLTEQPVETVDCPAARLLPTLLRDDATAAPGLDANLVIIDPLTGQILALVGDAQEGHTPGSLLSPFVYLTAFTRGFSPASLVWDIPASLPPDLAGYTSADGQFHGPVSIRTAMANDYITPAVQTLTKVGAENVWLTTRQSGLVSISPVFGEDTSRLLLDTGAVPLLEITHAYAMLANQGFLAGQPALTDELNGPPPMQSAAIIQVRDYSNRTWLDWTQPQLRAVTSAQLAYLITHVLSDEEARRPSLGRPNVLEVGRPAAAKLGQTTSQFDAWTVGYTPHLAIGVWVGYPEGTEAVPLSPAIASGLWNALLRYSHLDLPAANFDVPVGITDLDVCAPSGLLPTIVCPTVVKEIFIPGNEPIFLDNLYRLVEINRLTGRLATVFTPLENIDEQVFFTVPPEALEWARETGFPLPPETYDVLFITADENPDVTLASPAMFAYVRGQVQISGDALGEEFDFFRIQVGAGLNPRQWLQVGTDGISPVTNGRLALWDTGDANGLFAIQLLVVYDDQSVQTATIQVTVDNQAPEVSILYPSEGQVFTYPQERSLTFQIQASDNLGIARIEFYVDDELISSLTQAPFAAPWLAPLGDHILRVLVYDLAGNITETEVSFGVER